METKEIKEILTKVGITEDKCTMLIDTGYSEYNINYHTELVEAIQKFMNLFENQQDRKEMEEELRKLTDNRLD